VASSIDCNSTARGRATGTATIPITITRGSGKDGIEVKESTWVDVDRAVGVE
jgi:hypothetical protein